MCGSSVAKSLCSDVGEGQAAQSVDGNLSISKEV